MTVEAAQERITAALAVWEGISAHPHRFGSIEYRLGRREIGHIHGDSLVDIPFPTKIRDEIVAAGQAEPNPILPDSGWVSFYLRRPADINRAIELLNQSYQLALEQRSVAVEIEMEKTVTFTEKEIDVSWR